MALALNTDSADCMYTNDLSLLNNVALDLYLSSRLLRTRSRRPISALPIQLYAPLYL